MFIWKHNQKRCNIYAKYVDNNILYPRVPEELYEEIADPVPPDDYSDETYYRTEQDDAPYVIFTKKPQEQLDQIQAHKNYLQAMTLLQSTDYLFTVDRHSMLLQEEPEREASLQVEREAARSLIRQYNTAYPSVQFQLYIKDYR